MRTLLTWTILSCILGGSILACMPAEAVAPEPEAKPEVTTAAFPSAPGTLATCNQQDDNVYLARLSDGKIIKKIAVNPGPHEASASPSGNRFAITNYGRQQPGNSITIISLPSGTIEKVIDLGQYTRPHGIDWIDENRVVLTSESTQNLVVVNVKDSKVVRAMSTNANGSHMLALDAKGNRVYSADIQPGTVTQFELSTGKKLGVAKVCANSEGIAITPDGRWIWAGSLSEGTISVVDTKDLSVKNYSAPTNPYRVHVSSNGKYALVPAPQSGGLGVYNPANPSKYDHIPMSNDTIKFEGRVPNPGPVGVTTHPNGKYVYCAVHWSYGVAVVDLDAKKVVGKIEAGTSPDGVAVSTVTVNE